jgi:uncharacterized protein
MTTEPGRVAITGASGFIGRALSDSFARDGWEVLSLVRRKAGAGEVEWDPEEGRLDAAVLEGFDAFVHLAGENIFGIWTPPKKRRILESRTRGTGTVARALAGLQRPPNVLVSVSGVNYYGNSGEQILHEDHPPGHDFLSTVCVAWETAAKPAAEAGIRVVHPRFGIVLDRNGGALRLMLPAFRMGLGARLGSGRQWMSWINYHDAVRLLRFVIANEDLAGPVNAVAPQPVRNAEFTRALGRALHRPAFLAVPSLAIRTFTGSLGDALLLASMRVVPQRLLASGFVFDHPDIEGALTAGLDGTD